MSMPKHFQLSSFHSEDQCHAFVRINNENFSTIIAFVCRLNQVSLYDIYLIDTRVTPKGRLNQQPFSHVYSVSNVKLSLSAAVVVDNTHTKKKVNDKSVVVTYLSVCMYVVSTQTHVCINSKLCNLNTNERNR